MVETRVAESLSERSSAATSNGSGFSVISPSRLTERLHSGDRQRLRQDGNARNKKLLIAGP